MAADATGFAAPPDSPSQEDHGAALRLRGLHHAYGDLATLAGLELEVPAAGVLGIVGPSGCGKSTLLEIVCGLREQTAGEVAVDGAADPAGRLARCAFMPQRDMLFPWLSALDNAALALRNGGARRSEARRLAAGHFARLGLGGFEAARPAELSGGMRQRVAFLRTLVSGKPVLALDEPFASLDTITRAEMQVWLGRTLAAEPRTALLVTHDVEEALYLCDRVVVLSGRPGRAVATLETGAPRAADRDAAVTDPAFVAARERAMAALHEGTSRR